ncbi:hypothetical protein BDB01DRAFT_769405 [Pilobolus umbonatus]|nr:hypothetical protein BDB01DRAFT_769405 [Pilobolus umbonatus]
MESLAYFFIYSFSFYLSIFILLLLPMFFILLLLISWCDTTLLLSDKQRIFIYKYISLLNTLVYVHYINGKRGISNVVT